METTEAQKIKQIKGKRESWIKGSHWRKGGGELTRDMNLVLLLLKMIKLLNNSGQRII